MSPSKLPIACLTALTLAVAMHAAPVRAQHDHMAHAHVAAPPAPAQRWAADATLRDDVAQIHTALEDLRHYEMGHMDATMALDRVGLIEAATADIFAKCRLTPEKDAVLHRMLVPLLGAAQKLKADPQDMAQVAAMRQAMADYPRYFDAPSWGEGEPPAHMH